MKLFHALNLKFNDQHRASQQKMGSPRGFFPHRALVVVKR
uniref:Uncharacterized protein n=1 Tax=Anguilla anguilla TaxID=7936 RepID=A0A0E9PSQ9_ANGAN